MGCGHYRLRNDDCLILRHRPAVGTLVDETLHLPIRTPAMRTHALNALVAFLLCGSAAFAADDGADAKPGADKPAAAATVTPYPLDTCIVSGDKFGGDIGYAIF